MFDVHTIASVLMLHSTFDNVPRGCTLVALTGDGLLKICFTLYAVLDLDVALSAEVEEEDHHDGHEDDGRRPGVNCPAARHADACLRSDLGVGRVEQMDESCGNDHAGAEVASEKVDVERDVHARHALGDDRKEGGEGGDDQDDEQG